MDENNFEKTMTTDDSDIEMVDTFEGDSSSCLLDPDLNEANGSGH